MSYKGILDEVKECLPLERRWWPDYFYHFTDVHNAASIIENGWIYSRTQANKKNIMINDNASRVVIENTTAENKIYGRLYFRPLTPTQYHNEGYKPEGIRNHNINASCPVPVFFLLSVEKTMALPGTKFAERGLSGERHDIQEGDAAFSRLNFTKIYHDGPYDNLTDWDIKDYRQSEVVREGGFPLPQIIRGIMCRSNAERETLLYLLRKRSLRLYETYKRYVIYKPSLRMFYNNGIFIKEVSVVDETLLIELNSAYLRTKKEEGDVFFNVAIEVTYFTNNEKIIDWSMGSAQMNYGVVENMQMNLKHFSDCIKVLVKVKFDDAVMYENELIVSDDMMW